MSATRQLSAALRDEGGLLADALRAGPVADDPLLAPLPAGPYALTLAAVREGYLLHYADGNVVDAATDPDLALLGGDRLYALALAELATLGDLDAVAALAELISDCARAHADGEPAQAAAAWERAVAVVVRNRTR
ncbi:MAG: hypothetical protein ACTHOE_13340 [Conexibacter sp.]